MPIWVLICSISLRRYVTLAPYFDHLTLQYGCQGSSLNVILWCFVGPNSAIAARWALVG